MNLRRRLRPDLLATGLLESGGWLAFMVLVALGFVLGGSHGINEGIARSGFPPAAPLASIDSRPAAFVLLGLVVAAALSWVVPELSWRRLTHRLGHRILLAALAVLTGLAICLLPAVGRVWWLWVVALLLGFLGRAIARASAAGGSDGPAGSWLTAGLAAGLVLIVCFITQLAGGVPAGIKGISGLGYLAAVFFLAGAVLSFRAQWPPAGKPEPGLGRVQGVRRPASGAVRRVPSWGAGLVAALAGVAVVLSQALARDVGAGQAGVGFILLLFVLGAALGTTMSSRVLPGLSRPRLVGLSLVTAALLVVIMGIVHELTAMALLGAGVGWLGGLAAAAQAGAARAADPEVPADRSGPLFRMYAWGAAGAVAGLLLAALDLDGSLKVSRDVTWRIGGASVALLIVGVAGIVLGIVALIVLDPRRLKGIGGEIRAAWRLDERAAGIAPAPTVPAAPQNAPTAGLAPPAASTSLAAVSAGGVGESRGLFIAFEGGDGAGKSTQAQSLAAWLREDLGLEVVTTREPGGTPVGARLRAVLLDGGHVSPRAEALLFAADRGHHVSELIRPSLRAGAVVITDRYIDSSIAYQGAGRDIHAADIANLSRWATEGLKPDLTILLDLDPQEAAARRSGRGGDDRLEREPEQFHQRVRDSFLALADRAPERYLILDAREPGDLLGEQIVAAVLPLIRKASLSTDLEFPEDDDAGEADVDGLGEYDLTGPAAGIGYGEPVRPVEPASSADVASSPLASPAEPEPAYAAVPDAVSAYEPAPGHGEAAPAHEPFRDPAAAHEPAPGYGDQTEYGGPADHDATQVIGPLTGPGIGADETATRVMEPVPGGGPATEPVEILDALAMQRARLRAQAEAERAARERLRRGGSGEAPPAAGDPEGWR